MKIYISTPINGRKERTFRDKYAAAFERAARLRDIILDDPRFKDCDIDTPFNRTGIVLPEEKAIGNCITKVLACDAIYLDHDWTNSKGCRLEYQAAKIYGKDIYEHDKM